MDDTQMLDWIERHLIDFYFDDGKYELIWQTEKSERYVVCGSSLRDCIRNKRAGESEKLP